LPLRVFYVFYAAIMPKQADSQFFSLPIKKKDSGAAMNLVNRRGMGGEGLANPGSGAGRNKESHDAARCPQPERITPRGVRGGSELKATLNGVVTIDKRDLELTAEVIWLHRVENAVEPLESEIHRLR
jgi:hypothetical protein